MLKKPLLLKVFRTLILIDILLLIIFILLKTQASLPIKIDLREAYIVCLDKTKAIEKGQCLRKLAPDALKNHSTAEIESAMQAINNSDQRQWCHEFMHYVGWELYRKTHNMVNAFSKASSECDSGMFHGVVEEYINETRINYSPEKFISLVKNICEESTKNKFSSGMKSLCYHGLGHGFMLITDNNLNKSLQYCDYLNLKEACYTGAFMENTQSKQIGRSNHPSKFSYDQNNPDYPCNILDDKYKNQCYKYKGVSVVVQTSGNFLQAFRECLKVNTDYQKACFWGVGSDIPGPHTSSKEAGEKCKVAIGVNPQAYGQCIAGAMSFVVQLNEDNPTSAVEFCDVTLDSFKDFCYSEAGRDFGDWVTKDESLEKKCSSFQSEEAQNLCLHPGELQPSLVVK